MTKGHAIIKDADTFLTVNYEDFDVECFGGCDYEVTYKLDQNNRQKLWKSLKAEGLEGTLEQMILAHFGTYLDKDSFSSYCKGQKITFDLFTWIN